jgi:hypothetical protein
MFAVQLKNCLKRCKRLVLLFMDRLEHHLHLVKPPVVRLLVDLPVVMRAR